MTLHKFTALTDRVLHRYEYPDRGVYVADLGHSDATADVVGSTIILVTADEQIEFEVPDAGEACVAVNNGVLTIEVSR